LKTKKIKTKNLFYFISQAEGVSAVFLILPPIAAGIRAKVFIIANAK
jgi:hypothetical protein